MNDLKPCPFCGGKAQYLISSNYSCGVTHGWKFGINCTNCLVALPMQDFIVTADLTANGEIVFDKDDRKTAARMWNRRAEHGGEETPTAGITPNYCPNCGAKMDLEG